MIELGTENTVCGKFPPYIISCKELIGEGEPLNTLVIEIGVERQSMGGTATQHDLVYRSIVKKGY